MATLLKQDAIFLHVPKTGGTFLRRLFVAMDLIRFDFSRDHADMQRVLNVSQHYPGNFYLRSAQLGKNLETHVRRCYKFCFVRHPLRWYESYWRFMQDRGWQSVTGAPRRTRFGFRYDPWHPLAAVEKAGDADFNRFIENVIRDSPGFLSAMYEAFAVPGQIDFVGRQETLVADAQHVFGQLSIPYDKGMFARLGKVNESSEATPQWNAVNKETITRLEHRIFDQYGYAPE